MYMYHVPINSLYVCTCKYITSRSTVYMCVHVKYMMNSFLCSNTPLDSGSLKTVKLQISTQYCVHIYCSLYKIASRVCDNVHFHSMKQFNTHVKFIVISHSMYMYFGK